MKVKTYDSFQKIFEDKLLKRSDIVVFWGKPGTGKSFLEAYFAVQFMQPRNARADLKLSRAICDRINQAGYNLIPPDDHLVFCDTWIHSTGRRLKDTWAYEFDSKDFRLMDGDGVGALICPCGKYAFDEQQESFDSHMGTLKTAVSRPYELSRHMKLFIMIAMQRPIRLAKDIRDLATFVEANGVVPIFNKYGRQTGVEVSANIIYKNSNLEAYVGSEDEKYIDKKVKFVIKGRADGWYDSEYFLPEFFMGHKGENFVLKKTHATEFTEESFDEFLSKRKSGLDKLSDRFNKSTTKKKKKGEGDDRETGT